MPKVLLIEDGRTYRELAVELLQDIGCTVVTASSAEEGLRLARDEAPELIFTDINLPGMDGFDLVRELQRDPMLRRIPTIGLTGDTRVEEADEQKGREAGFVAFLAKPIDRASFRSALDQFLKRA